jgi:hypothetical protein
MHWALGICLRLVAFGFGLFFTYCESDGTYEYLITDQKHLNYIVLGGTGFATASALLPMYAGHLFRQRQWVLATAAWLAMPVVAVIVLYAAVGRTGGAVDEDELNRARAALTGSLLAKTEEEATTALKHAVEAMAKECATGFGDKCTRANGVRIEAQARVDAARVALLKPPGSKPNAAAWRFASMFSVSEAQVRLYQPIVVPIGMALLAALFLSIGIGLEHDPLPSWRLRSRFAQLEAAAPRSAHVNTSPTPASYEVRRTTVPSPAKEIDADPIIAFIKSWVPYVKKQKAEWGEMYDRCLQTWREHEIENGPPTREEFDAALTYICQIAGIAIRRKEGKIYCLDRKLLPQ